MKKFKVGDRVKVVSNSHRPHHHFDIGIVVEVQAIDDRTLFCLGESRFGSTLSQWVSVEEVALVDKRQKIVVTTDGKTTTAKLFSGKELVKSAEAKCSPCDEFDFKIGAGIAVSRLLNTEEKAEPEAPKFNKEQLQTGVFGLTNQGEWFVVVDDKMMYTSTDQELGGFDYVRDVDSAGGIGYFGRAIDYLVAAVSFKNAESMVRNGRDIIWSRPGATFK